MENKPGLTITELFMAKADWGRCFHGTIHRWKDQYGNPFVTSKITMHDGWHFDNAEQEWVRDKKPNITGFIYASDTDQWQLGEKLDAIILLVLDYKIHSVLPRVKTYGDTIFFLN